MEKITFLYGKETYDQQYVFMLNQDKEYQRLQYYRGNLHNFGYCSKKETDTHIYWQVVNKKVMFENDTLFFRHEALSGATYDKKKRNIKIWFGRNFNLMDKSIVDDILKTFAPWFDREAKNTSIYISMITNTILNRIIKGKVNTNEEIIKSFCKYAPYKDFNLDVKKLDYVFSNASMHLDIRQLKNIFKASKNPNDVVQYLHDNIHSFYWNIHNWDEISKLALSIQEKFDINWDQDTMTEKRMKFFELSEKLMNIHNSSLGLNQNSSGDLPF